MNNPLKFRSSEYKIWFISDLHFFHDKPFILNPRGYANIEESNLHIISSWDETVGENDIVFNLGDLCFGDGNGERSKFLIESLKCKAHYFIWGNHNSGVKTIYRDEIKNKYNLDNVEIYPLKYGDRFVFIGHYAEIFIDGQPIVLSHYPIASWNGLSHPSWNLHGHCHMNLKQIDGYRMDVGWDRSKRPISWEEVKEFMVKRVFESVDHHKNKDDSSL